MDVWLTAFSSSHIVTTSKLVPFRERLKTVVVNLKISVCPEIIAIVKIRLSFTSLSARFSPQAKFDTIHTRMIFIIVPGTWLVHCLIKFFPTALADIKGLALVGAFG